MARTRDEPTLSLRQSHPRPRSEQFTAKRRRLCGRHLRKMFGNPDRRLRYDDRAITASLGCGGFGPQPVPFNNSFAENAWEHEMATGEIHLRCLMIGGRHEIHIDSAA